MKKDFLKLEDITVYQIASELGGYVWEIVSKKKMNILWTG